MKFLSTRGFPKKFSFCETVFEGLAPDGGLFLPEIIPELSKKQLSRLSQLNFEDLASEILKLYIDDIPLQDIKTLIKRSYRSFKTKEITPLVKVGNLYFLELFHGPTYAFKDIALQFLGNLFEYLLEKTGKKINILGATSGDTGASAIWAVRHKRNIKIFILFPYKKVSPIQEMMMTSIIEPNIHSLAVSGSFDDCQQLVKAVFNDVEFKKRYSLTAINSINFVRILIQTVYYLYAYFRLQKLTKNKNPIFVVPTGNFGNVFAGFFAKKMLRRGIKKLIIATNENDILARFVNKGDYSAQKVIPTVAPSIDIQVASNLERYLYFLFGQDPEKTAQAMKKFAQEKTLTFDKNSLKKIQKDFWAFSVKQKQILTTIKYFYQKHQYLIDPHTAVGAWAALKLNSQKPVICLATASYAKFPETVEKALGQKVPLPEEIKTLKTKPKKLKKIENSIEVLKNYLKRNIKSTV